MPINRKKLSEDVFEDMRITLRRIFVASKSDMCSSAIPRSQAVVMHIVNANPGISVKDVAISMDISPSAATQLIDTLVKEGTISRQTSERDHRVVSLQLSKEGKVRLREYKSFQVARIRPILDVLTDQELLELERLHNKIHEAATIHPSMRAFIPAKTASKA